MKIRSMKIDNYKIFKNAVIGDDKNKIGKGIVVIGGFNRSGKSTFLEILSRLAWGFSKKKTNSIIEKYRMSCKIESADGKKEYEVMLAEDSKPVVRDANNNSENISMEELYAIDKFSYQNLFCLDLESLQKTHSDMDGKQKEKLQALLLGAGLSDYVQIPAIIKELGKNAVAIAGELNRPDVKTLGKYYYEIQKGIGLKKHALGQIEDYQEKKNELNDLEIEINDLSQIIKNLKIDSEKLQMIREDHQDYLDSLENIELVTEKFIEKSGRNDTEILRDLLNKNERIIRKFKEEVSGFKARINESIKKKNELDDEKSKIQAIIKKVNYEWDPNKWDEIKNIGIDETTEVRVNAALVKNDVLDREFEALTQRKRSIESQINNAQIRINKYNAASKNKLLLILAAETALLVPVALIVGFEVNMVLGIIIGAISALAALFLGIFLFESRRYGELAISDEKHLIELTEEMDSVNSLLGKCENEKEKAKSEMESLRKLLKLPEDAAPETLRRRFESLRNIREKINDYENLILKAEEHENSIRNDLDNYKKIFAILNNSQFEEGKPQWEEISGEGEKWFVCLELLNELEDNESKKNKFKIKLAEEMGAEPEKIDTKEEVRSAFSKYSDYLTEKYMITESSATGLTKLLVNQKEELEKKNEKLKESRLNCKRDIETLAATEKLEQAQKQIDSARAAMQKAAEDHAVYVAARTMLEEIQKEFLDKTKYKILSKAAKLFNRMTDGEYKEILPPVQLTDNDFQAELSSGEIQNSVDILSRGTAEQLFLAVRLSRIMDNELKLPVIIDDSLANFDTLHTNQTLKILSELSAENQTFILTCHPELIMQIGKNDEDAQYWELDKGKFRISDCRKLYEYLSGEKR